MTDWISKSEYAKATGKSEYQVQALINEGLLESRLSEGGGKWLIKVEKNDDVRALEKAMKELTMKVDMLSRHLGLHAESGGRL